MNAIKSIIVGLTVMVGIAVGTILISSFVEFIIELIGIASVGLVAIVIVILVVAHFIGEVTR